MVEVALHPEMEAIPTDVVPLVHVNSVPFVSYDLKKGLVNSLYTNTNKWIG